MSPPHQFQNQTYITANVCVQKAQYAVLLFVFSSADDKGSFVSDDKVESVVILGLKRLKRKPKLKSGV